MSESTHDKKAGREGAPRSAARAASARAVGNATQQASHKAAGAATAKYRANNPMPEGSQVQHWTKVRSAMKSGMSAERMNKNLSPLQSRNDKPATTLLTSKDGTKATTYAVEKADGTSQKFGNEHKFADRFMIERESRRIQAANPSANAQDVAEAAGGVAKWKMTGDPGKVDPKLVKQVNLAKGEKVAAPTKPLAKPQAPGKTLPKSAASKAVPMRPQAPAKPAAVPRPTRSAPSAPRSAPAGPSRSAPAQPVAPVRPAAAPRPTAPKPVAPRPVAPQGPSRAVPARPQSPSVKPAAAPKPIAPKPAGPSRAVPRPQGPSPAGSKPSSPAGSGAGARPIAPAQSQGSSAAAKTGSSSGPSHGLGQTMFKPGGRGP